MKRYAAPVAVITAVGALALGCTAEKSPAQIGVCTGVETVEVQPGDTYSGLVATNTVIDDGLVYGNVLENIYLEYAVSRGELPEEFAIYPQADGDGPGVRAGETVQVPERCDLDVKP